MDCAERALLAAPEDVVDGVPFWKFVVADAGAALFYVPLTFGLTYFFTEPIKRIMAKMHRAESWLAALPGPTAMLVAWVWR